MQRGLTLLELMLVMAVMGVVLGLGLGAFTAVDAPDDYALSVVRSTLRRAANQSLVADTTTRVRFEREGEDSALLLQELFTAGTWHFEDAGLEGAFGIDGGATNARVADDGFIGKALALGLEGAEARFDVEQDPAFDPTEGFMIELALRPEPGVEPSGHVLNLGRVVGVDLLPGGAVRGWIAPSFLEGVSADSASAAITSFLFVESPARTVRPGQWSRVRLTYDRQTLALDVDGVPYERLAADLAVRPLAGPLVLSSRERQGFRGDVDKLVTSFYVMGDPVPLPKGVGFAPQVPREVVFDGGALDARVHTTDVTVPVRFQDTNDTSHDVDVIVNLQGTVE